MDDKADQSTGRTVSQALWLRREIDQFEARWPMPTTSSPTLTFSWAQVERQMVDLAPTPPKRELAALLVSGTRKLAWCKPPEMVLCELLAIAATLADEAFQPELWEGPDAMT